MKTLFCRLAVIYALTSASAFCYADSVADKSEVTALIQHLYREPEPAMFAGRFNGKYDPKKYCALIKQYVHDSLITKKKLPDDRETCRSSFERFPGYDLQDGMGGYDDPPKHKLMSVTVNGELAEAVVEMPEYSPSGKNKYYVARVEAYLKRFPQGWRIYAARFYDRYVHPEDLRFLPGRSPEDLYRGSEEGQPPGKTLSADRAG